MSYPDLSAFLESLPVVEKRRKMLVFSEKIYKPTGEKITEGFRYYACDIGPVTEAATSGDFATLASLPFALDEDGDRDTSSVLVDLAWTPSGSFVVVLPVEYQDYSPTPVAPALMLEGDAAKAVIDHVRTLGD